MVRGWLGVVVQPVTPELSKAFGLEEPRGALVAQVILDSPAAEAGLEHGDVIVRFGDQSIQKMRELPRAVSNIPVGTTVEVEVVRDGHHATYQVEIGELQEPKPPVQRAATHGGGGEFGMQVEDLTPALRQHLGTDERRGVVVTEVDPDGPADRAGLRQGDIIIEVERKPVESAYDLGAKLEEVGTSALLRLRRQDAALYVVVKRSTP